MQQAGGGRMEDSGGFQLRMVSGICACVAVESAVLVVSRVDAAVLISCVGSRCLEKLHLKAGGPKGLWVHAIKCLM